MSIHPVYRQTIVLAACALFAASCDSGQTKKDPAQPAAQSQSGPAASAQSPSGSTPISTPAAAPLLSGPQKPAIDPKLFEERLTKLVDGLVKSENKEVTITAEGAPKVETREDGTVTGTTPRLTIKAKGGETTIIDPVVLTFQRGANDDQIPYSIKLPSRIATVDGKGKMVGEVTIGAQNITGVWREDLQTADKLDMTVGNITIRPGKEPGRLTIAEVSARGGVEDKGGGLFDAKYTGGAKGFVFEDGSKKQAFRIDELGFRGGVMNAKLLEYAKLAKEAGYTLSNPDFFKMVTTGQLDPKAIALFKRLPEFMGAFDYGYQVRGMSMVENGKTLLSLAKADISFGLRPETPEKSTASLTASGGGLVVADEKGKPAFPAEVNVTDSLLNVDVSGLPVKELWAIYTDMMPALQKASMAEAVGANDPANQAAINKATAEAAEKAQAVLTRALLGLRLRAADVRTPTIVMGGDGQASLNLAKEPQMPVGKFLFRFSGLEKLQEAMAKRDKSDEMAQTILAGLMGIKALAKPDPKAPAGNPGYLIEVEFTKEGKVLANGQQML